jgi:hypothetical protein
MSVLMNFYATQADKIVDAIESGDDLDSNQLVRATADFSLHIGEDALDEMLAAACEHKKTERIAWEDAVGADDPLAESAFKMSPAFIELFASLSANDFVPTLRPWLGQTLTPDFEKAISELIDVCRCARSEGLDVVFACSA